MAVERRMQSLSLFRLVLVFSQLLVLALGRKMQFGMTGKLKILQVADMHYGDGATTPCEDVFPDQMSTCSDLNTTAFLRRVILAEKPDLIVFSGDNIFGIDVTDPVKSMNLAFGPAIESNIPWVAILGNHDQESTFSRQEVMKYITTLKNTLSRVNPVGVGAHVLNGAGNYNLEIGGVIGSKYEDKSLLNLYFLDSGDNSNVDHVYGYGWIKASQQLWFQQTSQRLRREYMSEPNPQRSSAPGLAYFHIPLPEFRNFNSSDITTGEKQEESSCSDLNSGFFSTVMEAGDVKAAFVGHDHLNDFCGQTYGVHLCYAGGFGYHAYGKAGWSRRARVVVASLEKFRYGKWGAVKSIKTWKRLDDHGLTTIDRQTLWSKEPTGRSKNKRITGELKD
ncbi:probable inactive purple acid phosphatase 29 [Mercurialis annua]|uniref:probable inactive purple acid phosphatase 29 n=1 Tax=Mercurialis annua TaxID=3986 RepID=UPI00215F3091|nr:probable inactive purple acid phosphatase 29 [Mercurialis annua]